MASGVFQKGKDEIAKNDLDAVSSSDIVLILMSDSYTPDFTAQDFISDVNGDELDADGYTQGYGSADRQTPAGREYRRDDPNSRIEFDFDDVTWSSLGGGVSANNDTVGGVIIAEERTNDADSVLIAYDELNDNRATNGSDITYSPDSEGMFQFN
jgi:hypothetical protein